MPGPIDTTGLITRPAVGAGKGLADVPGGSPLPEDRVAWLSIRAWLVFAALVALLVKLLPGPVGLTVSALGPLALLAYRTWPGVHHWLVAVSVLWPDIICADLILRPEGGGGAVLAIAACLFSAPLQIRLLTWGCRGGRWDYLEPLAITTGPIGILLQLAVLRYAAAWR